MKKLFALLGICCLLVFTLSACGGSKPEGDMEKPAAEGAAAPSGEGVSGATDQAQESAGEAAGTSQESSGEEGEPAQ